MYTNNGWHLCWIKDAPIEFNGVQSPHPIRRDSHRKLGRTQLLVLHIINWCVADGNDMRVVETLFSAELLADMINSWIAAIVAAKEKTRNNVVSAKMKRLLSFKFTSAKGNGSDPSDRGKKMLTSIRIRQFSDRSGSFIVDCQWRCRNRLKLTESFPQSKGRLTSHNVN